MSIRRKLFDDEIDVSDQFDAEDGATIGDPKGPSPALRMFNEGGYNSTEVAIVDVIAWVNENRPDLAARDARVAELEALLTTLSAASKAYIETPAYIGDEEIEPGRVQRLTSAVYDAIEKADAALSARRTR
jgi:hypothetical protein